MNKSTYPSLTGCLALAGIMVLSASDPAWAMGSMGSGGVLNILLLVLIAYFLVRMFRRRSGGGDTRPGNQNTTQRDAQKPDRVIRPMDRHEAARQAWSHLRTDKSVSEDAHPTEVASTGVDFNEGEFLEGAKLFFSRVCHAADSRELSELKAFMTDDVYNEILIQGNNRDWIPCEIMLLNARVMERKGENDKTYATVFYDGQMRIGQSGEQSRQIRTAWEFSRDESVEGGLWTLENINTIDQ